MSPIFRPSAFILGWYCLQSVLIQTGSLFTVYNFGLETRLQRPNLRELMLTILLKSNGRLNWAGGGEQGSRNFWRILESNSTIEFDPKHDFIPVFGSLQHRYTTTQELRSRPFYLNISLKIALSCRGKTMLQGPKNWYAVMFWVKLNGGF